MERTDLSAIFSAVPQDTPLTKEETQRCQLALLQLLATQTEHYTMGESSSIPAEMATELLASLCFSLRLAFTETKEIAPFRAGDLNRVLARAQQVLKRQVNLGKLLLCRAKATTPPLNSISYTDTLNGITQFFKHYDTRFFAHQIPGEIDYQLAYPVSDSLLGITYITEYLSRLCLENTFCAYFQPVALKSVLQSVSPEYSSLLVNLYEPVAINAIGLALLHKPVAELAISAADRAELQMLLQGQSEAATLRLLANAANEVCLQLNITNTQLQSYLLKTAQEVYPRLKTAATLKGLFVSFNEASTACPDSFFCDGPQLEAQHLAAVVSELQDCQETSEKIDLALRKLHSIADLAEAFSLCFWGAEAAQLLSRLTKTDCEQLRWWLSQKPEGWHSETGWEAFL